MKVLLCGTGDLWNDTRPIKIRKSLEQMGHTVDLYRVVTRRKPRGVRHVLQFIENIIFARRIRHDIIHIIDGWDLALLPLLAAKRPKVFDVRSFWPYVTTRRWIKKSLLISIKAKLKFFITGILIRNADHVLTVDERLAQMVKRYRPKSLDLLRNMPMKEMFNGVPDTRDLSVLEFAFIGSIAPERGLREFLEAWHNFFHIVKRPCCLHIFGKSCTGDYFNKSILPLLNEEEGVIYHGYVPFEHIARTYRSVDCVVISGQGDHLQLKLGEAMVAGVPVILRDGPFHRAVVKNEGVAWIFSDSLSTDVDAMLQALLYFARFAPLLRHQAENRKMPFSWEKGVERLDKKYLELMM